MAFTAQTAPLLYRMDRVRQWVGSFANGVTNWVLFAGTVLVLGAASSWYMVEVGTRITTFRQGPWSSWINAAQRDMDPYTRARFARIGSLPLSTSIAQTYEARIDSDAQRLHSSCEYIVEGEPEASWWSLAVFNDRGLLIPNPADRYVFTSETVALNPDGSFFVVLSREARPGNWLPVGGAGRLTLQYTVLDPRHITVGDSSESRARNLPAIRRISCR